MTRRCATCLVALGMLTLGVAIALGALILYMVKNPQLCFEAYELSRLVHRGDDPPIPPDYTGVFRRWYASGMLLEEFEVKQGVMDGYYRAWYEEGTKGSEGQYADGEEEGTWTYHYPHDKLHMRSSWKNGFMFGRSTEWDMEGNVLKDGWRCPGTTGLLSKAEFDRLKDSEECKDAFNR